MFILCRAGNYVMVKSQIKSSRQSRGWPRARRRARERDNSAPLPPPPQVFLALVVVFYCCFLFTVMARIEVPNSDLPSWKSPVRMILKKRPLASIHSKVGKKMINGPHKCLAMYTEDRVCSLLDWSVNIYVGKGFCSWRLTFGWCKSAL